MAIEIGPSTGVQFLAIDDTIDKNIVVFYTTINTPEKINTVLYMPRHSEAIFINIGAQFAETLETDFIARRPEALKVRAMSIFI